MGIDNVNLSGRVATDVHRTQDAKGIADSGRSRGAGALGFLNPDRVQLSGLTSRISAGLEADGEARAERVRELARQVQSGSYEVDAEALAHKLIGNALDKKDL